MSRIRIDKRVRGRVKYMRLMSARGDEAGKQKMDRIKPWTP